MRLLLALVASAVLAAPAAAAAPTLPASPSSAKQCRSVTLNTYRFKVYVTRGKVSCKTARRVAKHGIEPPAGWKHYEVAQRPWSDAYVKTGTHRTIGVVPPRLKS